MGLFIQEVNDTEEFRSLKEAWNTLLDESNDNDIFLTWEWIFSWWQQYGIGKSLRILLVKDADKIIGIAPFMQSRHRGFYGLVGVNLLENICSDNCDRSGVILTQKKHESVTAIIEYLGKIIKDNKVIIRLSHIPGNSEFLAILREQYKSTSPFLLDEKVISACPYVELPDTWDGFFGTLSRNRRGILRRAMRSLEKDHEVELARYSGDTDLKESLNVLFNLHQKRWQLRNVRSKFREIETREFYFNISEAFHENGWLHFSFLNVDGKPASVIWGFIYNGKYYYMTPTFDLEYSNYKVGNVHVMKLLEESISKGLREFNFLKGLESHKSHWTDLKIDSIQVQMTEKGMKGKCRIMSLWLLKKCSNIAGRSLGGNIKQLINRIRNRIDD